MSTPTVGRLLFSFFEDYLKCQKGLRPTSIKSYRDTIKLFLQFVMRDTGQKLTRLSISSLTCERVLGFLKELEQKRGNHVRTRNQRLAALHTFFEYAAQRFPETLEEAARVAAVPTKRTAPPETRFLDQDEIKALFRSMSLSGNTALRDRALLLFLYNTGARVQEVAELRVKNLELDDSLRVHLHGKGDKWRVCPLWQQTGKILQQLLESYSPVDMQSPVFCSRLGRPLTRFGIYKIVRRHAQNLSPAHHQTGHHRGISPHVFRHTTAVHLLESGVEPNVIRGWLGHASLDTTNRYAEITFRMKQKALETCQPPAFSSSQASHRKSIWQEDIQLLKWLKSL